MAYCPRCIGELESIQQDGHTIALCAQCRGVFCHADELERIVGRPIEGAPVADGVPDREALCPECDAPMQATATAGAAFLSCSDCSAHWLDAGVIARLRAAPRAGVVPVPDDAHHADPMIPARAPLAAPLILRTSVAPGERVLDDRVAFGSPLVDLITYPIVAALACVVGVLGVGRTVAFLGQLWFHELGHAVIAWLSGRAALPLPVGFTFWREEPSTFTTLCVTFLIGVFAYASYREKRRAAVVFAGLLFALQIVCTLVVDDGPMIEWIIAGGLAGELLLSTVAIVAFYYPAPDKFRWDFFRFVLLVPAATTFASSLTMWIRIDRGQQGLPLGSILGAPGDGTGDVDRLMDDYGWMGKELTDLYRILGLLCLLVIVGHYAVFAVRAMKRRAVDAREAASAPTRV